MNLRFAKTDASETEEHFLWRIGQAYDHGQIDGNWKDICEVMNRTFRSDVSEYMGESAYRKAYQQAKRFYDAGVFLADSDYLDELRNAKHEIRKEKQKLFDERVALNKVLREEARKESLYDIVKHAIDEHEFVPLEYKPNHVDDGDYDLVIQVTDLHVGMEIDSPFNTYNKDVLQKRLQAYFDEIIDTKKRYAAQNAYVILGGDMIQGLIHINSRLEQKEGVVQQIMAVSDTIGAFLSSLSPYFQKIEVYTTAGNHSRTHDNPQEVKHGDNFDLLVPYVCKKILCNHANITIYDNYMDFDIAHFMVRGHAVYAAHGHREKNEAKLVSSMIDFSQKLGMPFPEICFFGHIHANGYNTIQGVKVLHAGCLCGMGTHAIDSRLTGCPEQLIAVVSEPRMLKAICDVQFT